MKTEAVTSEPLTMASCIDDFTARPSYSLMKLDGNASHRSRALAPGDEATELPSNSDVPDAD